MVYGEYEGLTLDSPEFRKMFGRRELLRSAWYRERLLCQQQRDTAKWRKHVDYLKGFTSESNNRTVSNQLKLRDRLKFAQKRLRETSKSDYVDNLVGTLGVDLVEAKK